MSDPVSTLEMLLLMKGHLFKYVSEWGRSRVRDWHQEIYDGYGELIGTEEEIYEFWGPKKIRKIQELYKDALKKYDQKHPQNFFGPEASGNC